MDLRQVGLNDYESKAYIALIELGSATAAKISSQSGVPYGRIYDVLDALQHKKLIDVVPKKTKEYTATSPENLKMLVEQKKKELQQLDFDIDNLKKIYQESEKQPVIVGTGRKAFYKLLSQMPNSKTYNYAIKYTSEVKPEWIRDTKEKIKKKIDVKTLARFDDETKKDVEKWKEINPNIKKIENKGIAMSIKDNAALISLIKSNTTILITDDAFCNIIKELFLAKYNTSEK